MAKVAEKRYETDHFVEHWGYDNSQLEAMDEVVSGDDSQNEPSPTRKRIWKNFEEVLKEDDVEDEPEDILDGNSKEGLENQSHAEVVTVLIQEHEQARVRLG